MRSLPTTLTIDLDAIRQIHRHRDGFITLHSLKTGAFENLVGVRPENLEQVVGDHGSAIDQDAYFSLNAFVFHDPKATTVRAAMVRKQDRLRYLCTAFADIDCHRLGMTPEDARLRVLSFSELIIPPPSGFAFSGRGLWVFWLLHDRENADEAQRAFPEKIELYQLVQEALQTRLLHLGADAKDPLRIARIPGSVNSKSGYAVRYEFEKSADGKPITYGLEALAKHLGVERKKRTWVKCEPTKSRPARRAGPVALVRRRRRELERLCKIRGGFREGCRNNAAWIYAWLLRCCGMPREAVESKIRDLGRSCRPPLSLAECRGAVQTGFNPNMRHIRDSTIADRLLITLEESAQLEKLPPAARFRSEMPPPVPKPHRISAKLRRQLILEKIELLKYLPSTREMASILEKCGCKISHVSVATDYKRLGITP